MELPYTNRFDAGRVLAEYLGQYGGRADVMVLALPRGGVPVAYIVAQELGASLDLLLVRKLGVPGWKELAMGAIATGGIRVLNPDVVDEIGIAAESIDKVAHAEQQELHRRERVYRGERPLPTLKDQCVILIDDGLATGATMRAAIQAVRQQQPARLVVAVPVAPAHTIATLQMEVDEVVCPAMPERFFSIGEWYEDFSQITDDEVRTLLERAWKQQADNAETGTGVEHQGQGMRATNTIQRTDVTVQTGEVVLEGSLALPRGTEAIVVFAHGSGSSRHSPRNQLVADTLNRAGMATLLFDLLTPAEEQIDVLTRALRFNIALLAERLTGTVDWVKHHAPTTDLQIGLFGASTGAAAALITAAHRPDVVGAVVSRGGRPDLAGDALPRVKAPTQLIVGGEDRHVIALNRQASALLHGEHRIDIVPGATHLFEEPGMLEEVARLACSWFTQHLAEQS